MSDERKLIALVGAEAGVIPYASTLRRQHAQAAALQRPARADAEAVPPGSAVCPSATLTDESPPVFISTPGGMSYVEIPQRRPLPRLLELSGREDTELLLVPESAGRGLARALVCGAACSVWFVPEGARPRLEHLLVPVDYSVRSADSLRVATGLARLSGGRCLAAHFDFDDAVLTAVEAQTARSRRRAAEYVRFIDAIDCLGVPVTPTFDEAADVARGILRVAVERDVDLIVLTTRGRSRLGNLLRPTVADRVIRESRVPVLVVKHFGRRLGLLATLRKSQGAGDGFHRCN